MMCFYIYVHVYFTHDNSYSGNILKFSNCYPVIYILRICSCVNKCMILFQRFIIPDVSIPVYIQFSGAAQINTL